MNVSVVSRLMPEVSMDSLVGKQLPDSSGTLTDTSTRSFEDPSRESKCQQPGIQLDFFVLMASAWMGLLILRGKPLAWDVTVPYTYADSHINSTSITAGAAAKLNHAATCTHTMYPVDL